MNNIYKYSVIASLITCTTGASLALAAETVTPNPQQNEVEDAAKVKKKKAAEQDASSDEQIVVTARQQTLQQPGVSIIDSEAIKKRPIHRDVSEIIRTMPGVNLTGNSTSGQRGNNRQIDIRGMGPENTLILVDGMPVSSKNAVRYGWRGERDTRGDSNWVPPEMIDRIEVIRGPAAAMYGNGAMGGVVNIITKQASKEWHGTFNTYYDVPDHKKEGATKRYNASLFGGLTDTLTMKLYGNWSKTQADARDINEGYEAPRVGRNAGQYPGGREGVLNKNLNGSLRWEFMPMQALELEGGFSRQGNRYAGDTQNTNQSDLVRSKYGRETNIIYRQTLALKYTGAWDNGVTTSNYVQFEKTRNRRINEGLSGGLEGMFSTTDPGFSTITLNDTNAHSEVNIPFNMWVEQTLTLGAEFNHQAMKDPTSNTYDATANPIPGVASTGRSEYSSTDIYGIYSEDNIDLTDSTRLTPGIRFNHQDKTGSNLSPSLNLSQGLGEDFTLKMGIARAWKAPNLYQTNPNYLLFSRGNGCPDRQSCYLQGNKDLDPETSVNKEIGIEYKHDDVQAGLTYYRNDYHNKIEAGTAPEYQLANNGAKVHKWENVKRAVVQGLEGTLNFPIGDRVTMNNNFTWMIENENKKTDDYLSIIPKYTINSTLDWQATDKLAVQGTFTWYGKQKPKKYDGDGNRTTGSERWQVSPYSIVGLSGIYNVTKNLDVTAGIDNLFDKRHFRRGNALNSGTLPNVAYGAGAQTYNESGRVYYMEVGMHL